jgi:hypothetical protein
MCKHLDSELVSAGSEGALLALIEERLSDFNSVNAATALFRLVKVRSPHTASLWRFGR